MTETRLHPIWKEAAVTIAARVRSDGYGFIIEMDELCELLEIKAPCASTPWGEAKRFQFELLERVEALKKTCLHEHNVCLDNERGRGYRVLTPDDQVTHGFARRYRKARKHIRRAIDVLVNVDGLQLSDTAARERDRNIDRSVFMLNAADKRRVPRVARKELAAGKE